MKLNSSEILERGIIIGRIDNEGIAQVGIDLNAIEIRNVSSGGFIPRLGKTIVPKTFTVASYFDTEYNYDIWFLSPGIYEVILEQGCKIPNDCSMDLYPRSSLARIGGNIVSPKWDPGFETKQMTFFMILQRTVRVAVGARLVQACIFQNNPVLKPYNGQFQGK
jgi:deoxycytidine triphosphate deaminase